MRPCWRMRPASVPASIPAPQKKSARTAPRIAPPVSCAAIRRTSGCEESGMVVARNTGAPRGTERGSTAMLWPAVSGAPSVPSGPSSVSGICRKKT